jgi:ribose 1,5-bisphosphate isomerase
MEKRLIKTVRDIQSVKIQGARNIAKSALYVYSLNPNEKAKKMLENARPTEPMLVNTLRHFDKLGYKKTLKHFDDAQNRINRNVLKLIKSNYIIFTHCHSTNVVNSLIYAKKQGKKFEVYNTETRPLLQGRVTARQLEKAGIKVTQFIDSAIDIALERKQGTRKADLVLLGADAILKNGVINKVGSGMIAELAHYNKIPVYIVADSWKFSHNYFKIEERTVNEVWNSAPKEIKIRNPAFELIDKKYISGVISELGILKYPDFLRKV